MFKRRKDESNTSWFAGVVSFSLVPHGATCIAYWEGSLNFTTIYTNHFEQLFRRGFLFGPILLVFHARSKFKSFLILWQCSGLSPCEHHLLRAQVKRCDQIPPSTCAQCFWKATEPDQVYWVSWCNVSSCIYCMSTICKYLQIAYPWVKLENNFAWSRSLPEPHDSAKNWVVQFSLDFLVFTFVQNMQAAPSHSLAYTKMKSRQ